MKLVKLDIDNFRSIKKCSIIFHELTAIAGENNAGKTAVLRALNSVFNYEFEKDDFLNCSHQYASKTITRIRIAFSDLPNRTIYETLISDDDSLHLLFTYNYSKSSSGRRLYAEVNGEKKTLDLSFIDGLKRDIDFVYIPANRSSRDIEWNERSIFSRLVKRYLEDHTKYRDRLSHSVIMAGKKITDHVLNNMASALTELIMYDDFGKYHFAYKDDIDYKIFLDKLGLDIVDENGNTEFPVSEYGSGIKSLTVIALHRMLATLDNVSIILGIEEPESNLHPQAQRKLIESLKESRQSCETQAIFATHSTVIIDALNHDNIVLVRRVKDEKRGFHSEVKQLADSFWTDHEIPGLKYNAFFRYRNSDFFFSRFIILTESTTDAQVIELMLKKAIPEKMHYISIVNLNGVDAIKYPFFLLRDLGIPFCSIIDKDFFTNYKNGKLEESRNPESFFPEYSKTIVLHDKVIDSIFDTKEKKEILQSRLNQSYTAFFDHVKQYGLLPMQYCLEMDLVANEVTRNRLFDYFNIPSDKRTNKELLIERKKAIKDSSVIIPLMEDLDPKDYPYSYKKIRKYLIDSIKAI